MNRRGLNKFVEIERMLKKEKKTDDEYKDFDFVDFGDDMSYM